MLKPEVLKSLVNLNVKKAGERLRSVAPAPSPGTDDTLAALLLGMPAAAGGAFLGKDGVPRALIAAGAYRLVEEATSPAALSRMEPTWHPWF
jgi:hypothetical protein